MKYLGLKLDSKWTFRPHFQCVAPRAERVSVALGRFLPNLRGPDERVRRLYVEVVHSIMLYGAPVWAPEMCRIRLMSDPIKRVQRQMALRVVRAYRTVLYAAATALARIPPIDLLADARKTVFDKMTAAKLSGLCLTARAVDALREQAKRRMISEWLARLRDPRTPGRYTVDALIPHFERWMERPHGSLTFRVTQVLSGHGCFGKYLHRIGKAPTSCCEHCNKAVDTALHTLQECEAWTAQRTILQDAIGADLSLSGVFSAILDSEIK